MTKSLREIQLDKLIKGKTYSIKYARSEYRLSLDKSDLYKREYLVNGKKSGDTEYMIFKDIPDFYTFIKNSYKSEVKIFEHEN